MKNAIQERKGRGEGVKAMNVIYVFSYYYDRELRATSYLNPFLPNVSL